MATQLAVLHVLKKYVEGDEHLNGEIVVFNTIQEEVLTDARRFHTAKEHNYTVLAIVLLNYPNGGTVWTDFPTGEYARWELPRTPTYPTR